MNSNAGFIFRSLVVRFLQLRLFFRNFSCSPSFSTDSGSFCSVIAGLLQWPVRDQTVGLEFEQDDDGRNATDSTFGSGILEGTDRLFRSLLTMPIMTFV